jgi:hypothetical protein
MKLQFDYSCMRGKVNTIPILHGSLRFFQPTSVDMMTMRYEIKPRATFILLLAKSHIVENAVKERGKS